MSVPPPEPGGKPIHLDDVLARLRSSLARSSDPHLALITNNGARVRPQQGGSFADAIAAKAPQISDALITGPRPHLSPEVTSSIPAVQKPFHHLAALGYDRLLPIIPPDGNLSPRSHLKRRIGGKVGPRGKMPGVRREDGWVGLGSWSKTRANVADLDAWHAMGAGVGLMTGNGLVAIDIDALDETTADRIERDAIEILGFAPMRVGRWPKRLLLYRTTDEIPFRKLMFRGIDGGAERVELSTGGRQCVVSGIHPGTGRPYEWRRPLVPFEALSIVDAGQLDAFFARLASWLPGATTSGTREAPTDRATVDQAALKGDLALIRSAVEATPNRSRDFDYDGWVKYAAALRGACRDSVDLGRELFVAFSERSDIVEPEEDPIHTYDGLTPPFAVGAEHIFRQAERLAGWTGRRDRNTTTWFDNDAASRIVEGPNRGLTVNDLERRRITPTPFTFTDPAAIRRAPGFTVTISSDSTCQLP